MCSAAKIVAIFALLWYNRAMEKNDITTSNTAETVALSRAEYDALKKELAQLQAQNQWLMEQLKLNKKKLFGQSSEKIKEGLMEQLSLNFNEAERLDDEMGSPTCGWTPPSRSAATAGTSSKTHSGNHSAEVQYP